MSDRSNTDFYTLPFLLDSRPLRTYKRSKAGGRRRHENVTLGKHPCHGVRGEENSVIVTVIGGTDVMQSSSCVRSLWSVFFSREHLSDVQDGEAYLVALVQQCTAQGRPQGSVRLVPAVSRSVRRIHRHASPRRSPLVGKLLWQNPLEKVYALVMVAFSLLVASYGNGGCLWQAHAAPS
jgi:hypothetical protein